MQVHRKDILNVSFARIHLFTISIERGTVRVKGFAQKYTTQKLQNGQISEAETRHTKPEKAKA